MSFTTIIDEQRAASAEVLAGIKCKREGNSLSSREIERTVRHFVAGNVPDYQVSAWLATVACMGLSVEETISLTKAYIGDVPIRRLSDKLGVIADKHSTGGVGDKTTFVVAPLLAACGVPIAKLSGRGLGYAGGTIDKLESIPGLRLSLSADEAGSILERTGMVIGASTANLAPGDAATYSVRDVTGTVESVPLIAASIMSKKIAFGADVMVLDVKTGSGALITEVDRSRDLAQLMQTIAESFGLRAKAVLSDMSQPLGRNVGNRLEVAEAISVLQGHNSPGLTELCVYLAAETLCLVQRDLDLDTAKEKLRERLTSGKAYEAFARWVAIQGGAPDALDRIAKRPGAKSQTVLRAETPGWVASVEAREVGTAGLLLGTGRLSQLDKIDPSAGIEVHVRVGDEVSRGDILAITHSDHTDHAAAATMLRHAISIAEVPRPSISVLSA